MDKVIYRKNAGKKRGYPLLTLSAVLTFTSERVEGTGSISLRCPPGAVLDPAQTAYIGEEAGVAIASPLGVVSGELCAVTTRNIPEGAGIRELDLPVDAENGYYAASFAASSSSFILT